MTRRQPFRIFFPIVHKTEHAQGDDPESVCAFTTACTINLFISQDECTTPCGRDGNAKLPVSIATSCFSHGRPCHAALPAIRHDLCYITGKLWLRSVGGLQHWTDIAAYKELTCSLGVRPNAVLPHWELQER